VKEFVEYSLELAALPVSSDSGIQSLRYKECGPAGPASLAQREIIHKEVFELVSGETGLQSVEGNSDLKVNGENPLHLEIDLVSPLRLVLLASVAFHEPVIKPGASTSITVSLLSQLPLPVDIDKLEVQFNQSECNFVITNSESPSAAVSSGQQGWRIESAPSLALVTNKWLRLTYDVKPGQLIYFMKFTFSSQFTQVISHTNKKWFHLGSLNQVVKENKSRLLGFIS
jgi:hypothetical protein